MRSAHPQVELRGSNTDQQCEYTHQKRRHTLSEIAQNQDAKQWASESHESVRCYLRRLGWPARSWILLKFHNLVLAVLSVYFLCILSIFIQYHRSTILRSRGHRSVQRELFAKGRKRSFILLTKPLSHCFCKFCYFMTYTFNLRSESFLLHKCLVPPDDFGL